MAVAQGRLVPEQVEVLDRLCQAIGVSSDVCQRIARGLADADPASTTGTGANTSPPLRPRSVAQLAWLGVDADSIEQLSPYVVLLPVPTAVNANTASREVLVAAIKGLDLATAERIVQTRQRTPFKKQADIQAQLSGTPADALTLVDVKSEYFEVRGRLRLSDRVVEQRSLVHRSQRLIEVLSVERINSTDAGN